MTSEEPGGGTAWVVLDEWILTVEVAGRTPRWLRSRLRRALSTALHELARDIAEDSSAVRLIIQPEN